MKFGLLKTKIETLLSESYKRNTFKNEIKTFKKLVLENKKIGKLFQVYNELSTNKGIDVSISNDFINECIKIYENNINKLTPKEVSILEHWVKDVNVKNQYETIDELFSNDITKLEKKIKSRKIVKESIEKKPIDKKTNSVKLPLTTMINVANKTISNYVENLSESEKIEFKNLLLIPEDKLSQEFNEFKNDVVTKLTTMLEEISDDETKQKINETLDKVLSEECDRLNYIKLKNLKESL